MISVSIKCLSRMDCRSIDQVRWSRIGCRVFQLSPDVKIVMEALNSYRPVYWPPRFQQFVPTVRRYQYRNFEVVDEKVCSKSVLILATD